MTSQAGQVRDQAQNTAGDLAGQAQEFAGQLQDQAQAAASQTQDRLRSQADQRTTQVGEQINAQASDLRSVGDALREQGKDAPAKLADRLAGYAEQAGSYLREADPDRMIYDAEQFGRQRPGTIAVGALVAGFAASRFLKASSGRRYSSLREGMGASGAGLPSGVYGGPSVGVRPGIPEPYGEPIINDRGYAEPSYPTRARIVEPDTVGPSAIAGAYSAPIPDALDDPLLDPGTGVMDGPGTVPGPGSINRSGAPRRAGRPVPGTER
jgi:hypothetical protein